MIDVSTWTVRELNDFFGNSACYSSDCLKALPDLPGLYLVTKNHILESFKDVLYIGMSSESIKRRWRTHHRLSELRLLRCLEVEWSLFCWVVLPGMFTDQELKRIERSFIDLVQPPLNDRLQYH